MRGLRTLRARASDESGTMLVELMIALIFLGVAVMALIAVFASSQISLRNAGIEGTALTLAESQIEVYKTMTYADMALSSATLPGGADRYVTENAADPSIPSASGQVLGGTSTTSTCAAPVKPIDDCAVQTLAGPDGRTYRVDTYLHEISGLKYLTVAVRQVLVGTPDRIRARATTAFDPANLPA